MPSVSKKPADTRTPRTAIGPSAPSIVKPAAPKSDSDENPLVVSRHAA